MKKLNFIVFILSALFFIGCEDDNNKPAEIKYSILGKWKPVSEVLTVVPINDVPYSDTTVFTTCQQESRWEFKEDKTGQRTDKNDMTGMGNCDVVEDRLFQFNYLDNGYFEVKYQGDIFPTVGTVTTLTDTTLNIKFETTTETQYQSVTKTFRRVE